MFATVFTMSVLVVLALAIAVMVAVGMKGKFAEADPRLRNGLAQVARHLNGDAQPPKQFVQVVERDRAHVG